MGFPLGNLLYSSCPPATGRSKLIAGDALCAGNSVPDTEFQESVDLPVTPFLGEIEPPSRDVGM
jgi:hypothetical protein